MKTNQPGRDDDHHKASTDKSRDSYHHLSRSDHVISFRLRKGAADYSTTFTTSSTCCHPQGGPVETRERERLCVGVSVCVTTCRDGWQVVTGVTIPGFDSPADPSVEMWEGVSSTWMSFHYLEELSATFRVPSLCAAILLTTRVAALVIDAISCYSSVNNKKELRTKLNFI